MMANVNKVKARKIRMMETVNDEDFDEVKVEQGKSEVKETKSSVSKKKVGPRKIRMSFTKAEEQKMDKEIEVSDNMSMGVIVLILVICFVVGIALGYFLYKIAINGAL